MSADLSNIELKIVENVRVHGLHINYIFDPDTEQPSFGYSVGLFESTGQPEVIIFGLSGDLAAAVINALYRKCKDGLELKDGLFVEGLLQDHDCALLEVPAKNIIREYFNSAMWFRQYTTGEAMTSAYQIVWPGAEDGLFPWDEGASGSVRLLQPPLSLESFEP